MAKFSKKSALRTIKRKTKSGAVKFFSQKQIDNMNKVKKQGGVGGRTRGPGRKGRKPGPKKGSRRGFGRSMSDSEAMINHRVAKNLLSGLGLKAALKDVADETPENEMYKTELKGIVTKALGMKERHKKRMEKELEEDRRDAQVDRLTASMFGDFGTPRGVARKSRKQEAGRNLGNLFGNVRANVAGTAAGARGGFVAPLQA